MDYVTIKDLQDNKGFNIYARNDICLVKGRGCKLYDINNKEYTDFLGGIAVCSLGYGNKTVVGAIKKQAEKLIHSSNLFYNEQQAQLLNALTANTSFGKAFICNSGAEANEAAIKLARKYFYNKGKNRFKIICAENSFHGRTVTTITATGQSKYSAPFKPLTPGFVHLPYNDINALEQALKDEEVCAVMLEPIQGEGGVLPATAEYLRAAREFTQKAGVLLIFDEVQTGIMRCGKLFCFENYGAAPDIITLAKGLGGGFPIGAMLARGGAADAFEKGDHGTTFGGNPLACAAANAVLKTVNTAGFADKVAKKGQYFINALSRLYVFDFVKKARGMGLMIGLPLDEKVDGKKVAVEMLNSGYIINCAGGNTLRFVPPLIISEKEIDGMTDALFNVFNNINNKSGEKNNDQFI